MKSLVEKWRSESAELEQQANDLDHQRNYDSTYYSHMSVEQRDRWNSLRNKAWELRIQRNLLNRLAAELETCISDANSLF